MRNIYLEKVANNTYQITLHNDAAECILSDGSLDIASVVDAVPQNSSLIVKHEPNHAIHRQYLPGSSPAKNFRRIAYLLSGNVKSIANEIHHLEALRKIYPRVEPFNNYNDAFAWSVGKNNV